MKILLEPERIHRGIATLAQQLDRDYAGQPLTLLALLNGSLVFLADLMRQMQLPVQIETLRVSSYRGTATVPGEIKIPPGAEPQVAGRHLLLVDDILDTGKTLEAVARRGTAWGALSVRTAVLLWKSSRTQTGRRPDYFVFEIPDEFVVGFGLDYNENYRQLPQIAVLESADLSSPGTPAAVRAAAGDPATPEIR